MFLQFNYLDLVFVGFSENDLSKIAERQLKFPKGYAIVGEKPIVINDDEIWNIQTDEMPFLDIRGMEKDVDYKLRYPNDNVTYEDTRNLSILSKKLIDSCFTIVKDKNWEGEHDRAIMPRKTYGVICFRHAISVGRGINGVAFEKQKIYVDFDCYEKILRELAIRKI